MTKSERIAAFRAAYAEYKATTTDSPAMSEGAFASHLESVKRAAAQAAAQAAAPAPAPSAPAPTPAPAFTRPKDRVWAGGDRDSDDITWSRG